MNQVPTPVPVSVPVPFEEDEWTARNVREELNAQQLASIGAVPDGYYNVDGTLLHITESTYAPNGVSGYKTVGWIPLYDRGRLGPQETTYFAWITPEKRLIHWSGPTNPAVQAAQAAQVLAEAEDPIEFGEAHAKATGICWRCGKPLSRELSITRGVGPICWRHLGGRNADESE